MVMVVAPRIQQSGPEDAQAEDWAQKLNRVEGEARRREKDRSDPSSDFNVTCNRPFHGSEPLEGNFSGADHRGSSVSPPPRPPTPVDHENREGHEAHNQWQGQRSLLLGWRYPENQESDSSSSSSSSSSGQDHPEFRKYHRGPPHGCPRMPSTTPPPFHGCDDRSRYQPPAPHRYRHFGFGKRFHHRFPPPPYYGFPPHGPPHHYGHQGPPHHSPHHPPKPPHRHFNHHGPPHHYNHHGPRHHPPPHHRYNHHEPPHHRPVPPPPPPPPLPPYHYDHHGLPHYGPPPPPPPPSHQYNRHGPPYRPAPPPHRYGPEGHRHPPPRHSRSGRVDGDEKHRGDQERRGRS